MSTAGAAVIENDSDARADDTRIYRGRSIDELIPRIEAELGADAIVVRRRRGLEGGIGGFFQRTYVEVEAKPGTPGIDVYDEDPEPARPYAPRPAGAYVTDTLATIAAAGASEPVVQQPVAIVEDSVGIVEDPPLPASKSRIPLPAADASQEFHELTADTFASALAEAEQALPATPAPSSASMPSPAPMAAADPIGEELDMLDRGLDELQVLRPRVVQAPSAPQRGRVRMNIERGMTEAGVSEELTQELIEAAIAHALPFAPRIGLAKAVHGALVARIPRRPLLGARRATVAVVGPGGSGKTSCCAALLGAYRRAGTLPASCATIMLVGEREEPALLLSPQIMEPEAIASRRARQTLAWAREEGLLLLDMPPLSPADRPTIRQMASVLEELRPDRVVVALPATLGAKAATQLLEALKPLGATAMAITHADETDQIGVAVEAACQFGLAPEYLLERSRVRSGLTRIDPTHLADRLLP